MSLDKIKKNKGYRYVKKVQARTTATTQNPSWSLVVLYCSQA